MAHHAARFALVAGVILLAGVILDLATLWVLQRQPTVQWEFVALGTTTNSYPLLLLSAVLIYMYLVFRQSSSIAGYRMVTALVLAMGLTGLTVLLLVVTNYFALMKGGVVPKEAVPFFRSVLFKAGAISGFYALLLIPAGVMGFRVPRSG